MEVYLIQQQNSNLYKIGVSRNPKKRIDTLQTSNPETLILIKQFKTKHSFRLENYLHKRYTDKNVQLEWFELDKVDLENFEIFCNQGESNFDILLRENTYIQDKKGSY